MQKIFEALWELFLARLNEESQKTSQASVARRLGVGRGNVTKWLNGTIKTADIVDFARYMDVLGMNVIDVLELDIDADTEVLIKKNQNLEQKILSEKEENAMLRGEIRLLERRLDRYESPPQVNSQKDNLRNKVQKAGND